MRVCIVTSEFVTESNFDGGLANYNYKLAKSLIKLGHSAAVIVSSDRSEEIMHEDIPVYRVNVLDYDDFLFRNKFVYKLYPKVKRYLKSRTGMIMGVELKYQSKLLNRKFNELNSLRKFDIVHYSSLGAVGFSRPMDTPVVSRISGSTIDCHKSGGYGDFDAPILRQQQLEFDALKKMDGIFGPSKMIAGIITKEIKREIKIIETPFLPPGEKLDEGLYNQKLKDKKYLLFFGSLGLIKGCGTIAEVIEDYFRLYPDHYFVFVGKVLGSPDPGLNMLQYLQKKAGNFAERVIHFEKTPHTQLFPIIQHSLFVVLPSRIDNFPNTCIEAMGNGKIVIGTRGNGFEQLITHGENGFLVNVDDGAGLLENINNALNLPPEKLASMQDNARKRIELLNPELIVAQLTGFYADVIKKFKQS